MRPAESKLVAPADVAETAARLSGRRIVSTNGCFDILHRGHLQYLEQARNLGDVLWVAVNADASVRRLKGESRPIHDERTRLLQLAALEAVDYVTLFEEDTPEVFLDRLRPAIHVKGGDYAPSDLPERRVVEAGGGSIVCLPFVPGFSTTALIGKLR